MRERTALLSVNRSSLFIKKKERDGGSATSSLIQALYQERPSLGYRKIAVILREKHALNVNHKKVLKLMKQLGIQGIRPKRNLSKNSQKKHVYPYLLKDLPAQHVNDAWCIDITYIRIGKGYAYLAALIDMKSRYIIGWHLSNSLDTAGSIKALENALKKGSPVIINSDQGVQYTSAAWLKKLEENKILISMDGKGRFADNILIERFWRSIKYEDIYLNHYGSMVAAQAGIENYFNYYNNERPHQALGYKTPQNIYYNNKNLFSGANSTITKRPQTKQPLI
jgi:putative transposase